AATGLLHVLEAAIQRGASEIGDTVLQALDALGAMIHGEPEAPPSQAVESLIAQLIEEGPVTVVERVVEPAPEPTGVAAMLRKAGLRIEASQLDRMRHAIGDLLSLRIRMRQLAEELRNARHAGTTLLDVQVKRSEAQLNDDALVLTTLVGAL